MSNNHKPFYDMTEEEKRKDGVRSQLALNRIARAEKHVPPIEGEYCYFDTRRSMQMDGLKPCARYDCVTDQSKKYVPSVEGDYYYYYESKNARYVCITDQNSVGVDFSISEYIDTYRSPISYQGVLHKIEHDHGFGKLFTQ